MPWIRAKQEDSINQINSPIYDECQTKSAKVLTPPENARLIKTIPTIPHCLYVLSQLTFTVAEGCGFVLIHSRAAKLKLPYYEESLVVEIVLMSQFQFWLGKNFC